MKSIAEIKQVCGDGVLVRAIKPPEKLKGFYIPENARSNLKRDRKQAWAVEVIKWGPDFSIENYKPRVGDILYADPISKDCPNWSFDGEDYFLIKDDDCLAIYAMNGGSNGNS